MKAFIADVIDELVKRCDEAQAQMEESPGDSFTSGRALAYQEIEEIVKNRMDIYRISNTDGKPQFTVETRSDQNKLFAAAVKASYQKGAK